MNFLNWNFICLTDYSSYFFIQVILRWYPISDTEKFHEYISWIILKEIVKLQWTTERLWHLQTFQKNFKFQFKKYFLKRNLGAFPFVWTQKLWLLPDSNYVNPKIVLKKKLSFFSSDRNSTNSGNF